MERNNMKQVLIITHLFYPEVASTAQLYTDIARHLKNYYKVTVLCSVPCYKGVVPEKYKAKKLYFEEYKGIKIIRFPVNGYEKTNKIKRIKHIISVYFNSKKAIKRIKKNQSFDLIFSTSQPPIIGGMIGVYAKRLFKSKMIYNIQDFQPEQTIATGFLKNKLVLASALAMDNRSCKKSDLVITVGRDMAEQLSVRFKNKNVPNNIVINNWIDDKQIYPLPKDNYYVSLFREKYEMKGKFVIMYSGNIGLYYDLENIIKVIAEFKDCSDVVFAFVGDGALKNTIQDLANSLKIKNIVFIPYQKKEDLIYSLNAADIHIVCNSKGIKGVSVPSKIYGILATNIPCIAFLEKDSTAYYIVIESNCGIVCEPGDYQSISSLFKTVITEKDCFVKKHETGRHYLEEHLSSDVSLKKYKEAIFNIIGE